MTTTRQIKALEDLQRAAWEQQNLEKHAEITAMLRPLYEEQAQAMRDRLARCAELRRGLKAYQVFTSGLN